jgi:hypothetical protein
MHGGRKHGVEICGVKSCRRPRHTRGCSAKEVVEEEGRAMTQAVSRRSFTAEARVRSQADPCEICSGQSGSGTGFSPGTSAFPCQHHSSIAA